MLEKTLESPLDSKEIKPVNPKGNQAWIFIGRIDAEAEAPIFWQPDEKSWLIEKKPDAGKDWRQERRGWQRKRWLVAWHHQLNGYEFEQALGDRWWRTGKPGVLQLTKSWTWLSDWTATTTKLCSKSVDLRIWRSSGCVWLHHMSLQIWITESLDRGGQRFKCMGFSLREILHCGKGHLARNVGTSRSWK